MSNKPSIVRLFSSMEEVRREDGFRPDHPVTPPTFKAIVGHYAFRNEEKCCVQNPKTQALCAQKHKKGYVVRLHDGTVTIIGGDCGRKKFGADATFNAEVSSYEAARDQLKIWEATRAFAPESEKRKDRLQQLQARLVGAEADLQNFISAFGPEVRRRMLDMARSGQGTINVIGIRTRVIRDPKGVEHRQTTRLELSAGKINGIHLLSPGLISNAKRRIENSLDAIDKLPGASASWTVRELTDLNNELSRYDSLIREIQGMLVARDNFFASDLSVTLYLSAQKEEREKASDALKARGKLARISAMDASLCARYRVERILVP